MRKLKTERSKALFEETKKYLVDGVASFFHKAVIKQLDKGSHLSAATPDLCTLSKKLTEVIPCAERVSYQNSGTEANMHAFRLAREDENITIPQYIHPA